MNSSGHYEVRYILPGHSRMPTGAPRLLEVVNSYRRLLGNHASTQMREAGLRWAPPDGRSFWARRYGWCTARLSDVGRKSAC